MEQGDNVSSFAVTLFSLFLGFAVIVSNCNLPFIIADHTHPPHSQTGIVYERNKNAFFQTAICNLANRMAGVRLLLELQ